MGGGGGGDKATGLVPPTGVLRAVRHVTSLHVLERERERVAEGRHRK